MSVTHFREERCVMCGEVIEEGRQVCLRCEKLAKLDAPQQLTAVKRKQHGSFISRLFVRKDN